MHDSFLGHEVLALSHFIFHMLCAEKMHAEHHNLQALLVAWHAFVRKGTLALSLISCCGGCFTSVREIGFCFSILRAEDGLKKAPRAGRVSRRFDACMSPRCVFPAVNCSSKNSWKYAAPCRVHLSTSCQDAVFFGLPAIFYIIFLYMSYDVEWLLLPLSKFWEEDPVWAQEVSSDLAAR